MLEWLGDEGDQLRRAFEQVVGGEPRPFGSSSTRIGGVSDGNEGVQWNAGIHPDEEWRWVGVNLEGMEYSEWPVERLIRRELESPTLPGLARMVEDASLTEVIWRRDYWQAASRPKILERNITPTPISLDRLTEERWWQALAGARLCLDPDRGWRGRASQEVTLSAANRKVQGPVSPHLTIRWKTGTADWTAFLEEGTSRLRPIYEWAVSRAAP